MTSITNTLDDSFFNKCRLDYPPGILTAFGETIHQFCNTRLSSTVAFLVFLVLPLFYLQPNALVSINEISRFVRARLQSLFILHRLVYPLYLVVVLYNVFRQHRPCTINGEQVGPLYGLPSGDAMLGGLLFALFWSSSWASKAFAVLVLLGKSVERLGMGLHSLGQVTFGSVLGVMLHFYSTHVPLYALFLEALVQLVVGCTLTATNPEMIFFKSCQYNYWAWLVYGATFQIMTVVLITRHVVRYYHNPRVQLKKSYAQLMREAPMTVPLETLLVGVDYSPSGIHVMQRPLLVHPSIVEEGGSESHKHEGASEEGELATPRPLDEDNAAIDIAERHSSTGRRSEFQHTRKSWTVVARISDAVFTAVVVAMILGGVFASYLIVIYNWGSLPGVPEPVSGTAL